MPFKKGNKLGKIKKGTVYAKTQQWENIVGWLAGNGGSNFKDMLEKLSNDEDIGKNQEKFMDYYMSLLEYHQPKLARTESKVEVEGVGFLLGINNEK